MEALIRLIPGAHVVRHRIVGGKDVDLLVAQEAPLTGRSLIAVECKHNKTRPLSTEAVRQVWHDYEPLVAAKLVDQIHLVTQSGIVANAATMIDGLPMRHSTYRSLLDKAFSPERLVQAALRDIESDGLASYYERPQCRDLDVALASRLIDLYYHDFVDYYALEKNKHRHMEHALSADEMSPVPKYREIRRTYQQDNEGRGAAISRFSERDVLAVLADRSRPRDADLLDLVLRWLDDATIPGDVGLALLGSYGTGKSAFSRFLATFQASRYIEGTSSRIPLRIELRHFGSHQSVEGLIADELANRHRMPVASFDVFQELNAAGHLLVILDGFDEMREGMSTDALEYNFAEIGRLLVGQSRVVLCGRPTIFESHSEQRAILGGTARRYGPPARYLQIELSPLPLDRVRRAIRSFARVRRAELGPEIDRRIDELDRELDCNIELQELVGRPVHFPMLVRVLPGWHRPLRELNRARLYGAFIEQIIDREMRKQSRPSRHTTASRIRFAGDLAVAMHRAGDTRSIRTSAIPAGLVEQYRLGDEGAEETRRELVRACFLERKPPDVLFFPHKSFGEYLVATRLRDEMRAERPALDAVPITLSPEIASFLGDVAEPHDWTRVVESYQGSVRTLRSYLRGLGAREDRAASSAVEYLIKGFCAQSALSALVSALGHGAEARKLAIDLAEALERAAVRGQLSPRALTLLATVVAVAGSEAQIHAVRATGLLSGPAADELVKHMVHGARREAWVRLGWIDAKGRILPLTRRKSSGKRYASQRQTAITLALRIRLLGALAAFAERPASTATR